MNAGIVEHKNMTVASVRIHLVELIDKHPEVADERDAGMSTLE